MRVGAWRSLVAHLFWVQGVVSSNLAAPTISRYSGALGSSRNSEWSYGHILVLACE